MRATEIPSPFTLRKERPLMVMDLADWDHRAADGGGALVRRLRQWASEAQWQLLAFHRGRIVRRMDNGLIMQFADARSCLQAAFALGRLGNAERSRSDSSRGLGFRTGAILAENVRAGHAIAGREVNLALALAEQAQPGEVLVTAELRNRLADGVDANFEDLADRTLAPGHRPVRLFRAHPPTNDAPGWATVAQHDLRPGLAVMPFEGGIPEARRWMVGELIADGVIARLSRNIGIRVISRQSTSALRGLGSLGDIGRHLGASFVLSGRYSIRGKLLTVDAELADAKTRTVLWRGQLQQAMGDLFRSESELLFALAHAVARALGHPEVSAPLSQPLPGFDSNMLLLAGISMTHSDAAETSARGREALAALSARHPELALPRAWLAMWHALNVIKGKSRDIAADTTRAREQTARALELEPRNALALAVEGYIQCQLLGDPQRARHFLDAAIEANPSEPMVWLFRSLYSGMWGAGSVAVEEACIARALSPADPLQYFFDVITANALFTSDQYTQAAAYARRSLRADKHHVPTLRVLATSQFELGQIEEGKETLARLRAEVPGLTVSSYLAMGSADSRLRQRYASAMRQLGLAEN